MSMRYLSVQITSQYLIEQDMFHPYSTPKSGSVLRFLYIRSNPILAKLQFPAIVPTVRCVPEA